VIYLQEQATIWKPGCIIPKRSPHDFARAELGTCRFDNAPGDLELLLAFGIIYFVLAIRIGVREVPPFLLAAIRFIVAGMVLFAWMRLKELLCLRAGNGHRRRWCRTDFRPRLRACLLG